MSANELLISLPSLSFFIYIYISDKNVMIEKTNKQKQIRRWPCVDEDSERNLPKLEDMVTKESGKGGLGINSKTYGCLKER